MAEIIPATTECMQGWNPELLRSVLENVNDAIIVVDRAGRVTYINRFYAERLGVPPEKIVGRNLRKIEPDAALLQVLDGLEPPMFDRVEFIKSLNIDSVGKAFPLCDQNGETVGACALFKDVTDLVKLSRKLQKSKEMTEYLKSQLDAKELPISFQSYICNNEILKNTLKLAAKVAKTDCTILIEGDSGVGKEVMTKCIHHSSPRSERPLIKVNCASIPEHLLESELFGYEEGAFTGARKGGKLGKFELANRGTLFLDEIGDMTPPMQAKLLRVIQEKELERVGGTRTIPLDVRVIAATNRNLAEMVESGAFRRDLYYRLHVIPIFIPPLRERREDIMPLVRYFIRVYGGTEEFDLTPGVVRLLEEYDWPGNIRELQNVLEYAMIVRTGMLLEWKDLPQYLRPEDEKVVEISGEVTNLKVAVDQLEEAMIRKAIDRSKGNKSAAIQALGISRRSFYEKLERYGLQKETPQQEEVPTPCPQVRQGEMKIV